MKTPREKLELLATAIGRCRKCRLCRGRLHAVPGEGNPGARVMFVGEAPGAGEDRTGRPFIGPAGKFLDQLFSEYEIRRSALFLTSCVKCRPPGNCTPRGRELDICVANWLLPQIEIIKPEIVVLSGLTATRKLLGEAVKLADVHGTLHKRDERSYFITYHPAAGMRFPAIAAAIRSDFKLLAGLMTGVTMGRSRGDQTVSMQPHHGNLFIR